MDGYQTVFTGGQTDGMKRGYHYTFGFKVRMQVENTSILYPDEYKQQIVGGIGMLSSLSVGAPRQSTSVSMYLKDTIGDGTDDKPYQTIWLEQTVAAMRDAPEGATVVRLHTGDPCLYGAIAEQMRELDKLGLAYEVVPGVSSFCGAAAAIPAEYTPAEVSQTLIITRMAGRTPVPEQENLRALASHRASMTLFLSVSMLKDVCAELTAGGYPEDTPVAVVYKATWPEQEVVRGTLADIAEKAAHIKKTALILVGDFLRESDKRSKLYDPAFAHACREAETP